MPIHSPRVVEAREGSWEQKQFPAESSSQMRKLEKASTGSGPMLANFCCAKAAGAVAMATRTMQPTISIHLMLCVIARPALNVSCRNSPSHFVQATLRL